MATPQINLSVTLKDLSGVQIGDATAPAIILITLCGFGPVLPRIAGTAMLAKTGPWRTNYVGSTVTIPLWGNDQITPGGTFYTIEILDGQGNVVQCGAYSFTGSGTVDLSSASQITPPSFVQQFQGYIAITWTGAGSSALSGAIANMFDITLQANMSPTIINFIRGSRVQFLIQQDGTGGHTFTWPANVKNPPLVSTDPNAITTGELVLRNDGFFYPTLGWTP